MKQDTRWTYRAQETNILAKPGRGLGYEQHTEQDENKGLKSLMGK